MFEHHAWRFIKYSDELAYIHLNTSNLDTNSIRILYESPSTVQYSTVLTIDCRLP